MLSVFCHESGIEQFRHNRWRKFLMRCYLQVKEITESPNKLPTVTEVNNSVNFIKNDTIRTTEINTTIVDGYVGLLDNLRTNNLLELISKLTSSVKSDLTDKKSSFKKAFGAFDSKKSTEKIIEEILTVEFLKDKLYRF